MTSPRDHVTLTLDMPLGALSALRMDTAEFTRDLRLAAAIKWYERGLVSQEKAAEIAGLCRQDFLLALTSFAVTPFQYDADTVLREANGDS